MLKGLWSEPDASDMQTFTSASLGHRRSSIVHNSSARLRHGWMLLVVVLLAGVGVMTSGVRDRALALDASFGSSKGIWVERSVVQSLPTSGNAWDRLAADAVGDWGVASLAYTDSRHDVYTLAGALYAVRMNDTAMRARVVSSIESAIGTEDGGTTLALGRNLTGYVLAADLVGYGSARFSAWLDQVRVEVLDGRTLLSTHMDRPNNWGTHAGAARIAAARYLGDEADLAAAVRVFRGYLGDRGAYAGFEFGDPEWQADPSAPVPINPAGSVKNGYVVDGAIVDDVRRCVCVVTSPAPKENYQWEAMQGIVTQATLLDVAGYDDVWRWSDAAIARAVRFLYEQAQFPAEGDDRFLPYLIDTGLGTGYSVGVEAQTGKSIGYTDWTHRPSATTTTAPTTTTALAPATRLGVLERVPRG